MIYQTPTFGQSNIINNNNNFDYNNYRYPSNVVNSKAYYDKTINQTYIPNEILYNYDNKIINSNYQNYNNNTTYLAKNDNNPPYLNNKNILEYNNIYNSPNLNGCTSVKRKYFYDATGKLFYIEQKQPINNYTNNINYNNFPINSAKVTKLTDNHLNYSIETPTQINQTNKIVPVVKVITKGYNINKNDPNIINNKKQNNNSPLNELSSNNKININNNQNQTKIEIQNNEKKIIKPNINSNINTNKNINSDIQFQNNCFNKNKTDSNTNNINPNQTNIPKEKESKNIMKEGEPKIPNKKAFKKKPFTIDDYKNIIYKDIGIINLGNTCYINSSLQVLIHCPAFINRFLEKIRSINKGTTICNYFLQVCKDMVDTINTQQKYIDITNFKTVFGTKHPNFDGYLQNDSQEFCRVFLEDISNELNEIKNKAPYTQLTNSDRISKRQRDIYFDKNFNAREKSIITELFYSQVITTFKCECKTEIYSFQKLLDFPLLLPEKIPKLDIKDLLKIYCKTEVIDFETPCEKCKKVVKHQKEIKISRPPEILILSLQRTNQTTQKKNECIVTFPDILDISEFLDHECGHDYEPLYSLFAVINHSGNIDCGHYYSFIKMKNKTDWYWYLFNDSSVKNIGKNNPNFQNAYVLFYIKNKYINK